MKQEYTYFFEGINLKFWNIDNPTVQLAKTNKPLSEGELYNLILKLKQFPKRFQISLSVNNGEKKKIRTYTFGEVMPFDNKEFLSYPMFSELLTQKFCVKIHEEDGKEYTAILMENDIVLDNNKKQVWPPFKPGFIGNIKNYLNGFKKVR